MAVPQEFNTTSRKHLRNARIIDVAAGAYRQDVSTLTIENGRITALRSEDALDTAIAQGETGEVISLGDRSVAPGLMNSHCHIRPVVPTLLLGPKAMRDQGAYLQAQQQHTLKECVRRGITYLRDAQGDDLSDLPRLRRGPGPRIQQTVVVSQPHAYMSEERTGVFGLIFRLLGMTPPPFDDPRNGVVVFDANADERAVRRAVDIAIDERGAEVIKIGEQLRSIRTFKDNLTFMSPEQFGIIVDQAQQRGLPTTAHQTSVSTFRRVLGDAAGKRPGAAMTSMAHLARDADINAQDVKDFIAADCTIEPTVSVLYAMGWAMKDEPLRDTAGLKSLDTFRRQHFSPAQDLAEYWLEPLRKHYLAGVDAMNRGKYRTLGLVDLRPAFHTYSPIATHGVHNLRMLFAGGARLGLANDGGIPHLTAAMLDLEIALLDLYLNDPGWDGPAFTGADALRMGTLNNAIAMGLEKNYGSLDVGKVADLVVRDGDPLTDLRQVAAPAAMVFMDGELVAQEGHVLEG